MADRPLDGEVALVTGASAGIGRATARAVARDGAAVAVTARRESRLRSLVDSIEDDFDVPTAAVPADVTDETAVERAIETAVETLGRLDAVVNNAGTLRAGSVEDLSTDAYREMVDVNLDGVFFTTRAAIPHLRETEGTVVFVGSNAGIYPFPPNPVYAATNWGVRGFAHSLAAGAGDDFTVSVINPSTTRTEIGGRDGTANVDQYAPGAKLEPKEVADAIAFVLRQRHPNAVNELNLFRQDELGHL